MDERAKQRVALAEDVIVKLRAGQIIAVTSRYVDSNNMNEAIYKYDEGVELQTLLRDVPSCEACAKGSLFLTEVMKNDNYKVSRYNDLSDICSPQIARRLTMFDDNQLDLIETAYEREVIMEDNDYLMTDDQDGDFHDKTTTDVADRAIGFGEKYNDKTDRMIAIMENLIKNNGEFIP